MIYLHSFTKNVTISLITSSPIDKLSTFYSTEKDATSQDDHSQ